MPGSLTEAEWDDDPTQEQPGHTDDEAASRALDLDLAVKAWLGDSLEGHLGLSWSTNRIETDIVSLASYTDVEIATVTASPRATLTRDLSAAVLTVTSGADLSMQSLAFLRFDEPARRNADQVANADLDKNAAGLYATAGLDFGRISVEAGGRVEIARIAAEGSLGSTLDDSKEHRGLAATASLQYRVPDKARAWVRFDRTYRYPFLDEQISYYNYGFDGFLEDLDAEQGYGVAIGAAAGPFAGLEVSADAHLLDMSDEIAFNGATFANENLSATRHLGATAGARWVAGPVEIGASYTGQLTTFRSGDNEGNRVPLVPDHEVVAEAKIRAPFGIELAATGRYVSESYQGGDNANNQDRVPQYALFGSSVAWRPAFVPGRLELFAGVENLLDADYSPLACSTDEFEPDPAERSGYYPAPGRSWRVGGS